MKRALLWPYLALSAGYPLGYITLVKKKKNLCFSCDSTKIGKLWQDWVFTIFDADYDIICVTALSDPK